MNVSRIWYDLIELIHAQEARNANVSCGVTEANAVSSVPFTLNDGTVSRHSMWAVKWQQ